MWGTIPTWITALVALLAFGVAFASFLSQRELARKKAAFDFFAKTEMDKSMLDAHTDYLKSVETMKAHLEKGGNMESFEATQKEAYANIKKYLNLHELIAVGIQRDVFDDYVCFDYWADELFRVWQDGRPFIDYMRSLPGTKHTFSDLIRLHNRWLLREQGKSTQKKFTFDIPFKIRKLGITITYDTL